MNQQTTVEICPLCEKLKGTILKWNNETILEAVNQNNVTFGYNDKPEYYTCFTCPNCQREKCRFAFDGYNLGGSCLLDK